MSRPHLSYLSDPKSLMTPLFACDSLHFPFTVSSFLHVLSSLPHAPVAYSSACRLSSTTRSSECFSVFGRPPGKESDKASRAAMAASSASSPPVIIDATATLLLSSCAAAIHLFALRRASIASRCSCSGRLGTLGARRAAVRRQQSGMRVEQSARHRCRYRGVCWAAADILRHRRLTPCIGRKPTGLSELWARASHSPTSSSRPRFSPPCFVAGRPPPLAVLPMSRWLHLETRADLALLSISCLRRASFTPADAFCTGIRYLNLA